MKTAIKYFKKVDPVLYDITLKIKLSELIKPEDSFIDLINTIISQQLSEKAATIIFGRFKKLFKDEKVNPYALLEIEDQIIRNTGISYNKIKYIKGIAEEIISNKLELKSFEKLNDQEVINELLKLKGVGQWTAEMYLMFTLIRPDVFSTRDIGLQNAMIRLYKLEKNPNKNKLLKISRK